ncbi:helix-turn-helix domain-containing protein [Streptomyces sp. TBY4]|uniref:helix-turn-helix domain-containing protein n=1 Tax=Streptomyces sp. TBY4 TaxID=2962030 RepID=UPI0035B2CB97
MPHCEATPTAPRPLLTSNNRSETPHERCLTTCHLPHPSHPNTLRNLANTLLRGIFRRSVPHVTPHGAAIKALREAREHSVRHLAHLTERHPSTILRVERGERGASAETLHRIAAALDVPIEAITREMT